MLVATGRSTRSTILSPEGWLRRSCRRQRRRIAGHSFAVCVSISLACLRHRNRLPPFLTTILRMPTKNWSIDCSTVHATERVRQHFGSTLCATPTLTAISRITIGLRRGGTATTSYVRSTQTNRTTGLSGSSWPATRLIPATVTHLSPRCFCAIGFTNTTSATWRRSGTKSLPTSPTSLATYFWAWACSVRGAMTTNSTRSRSVTITGCGRSSRRCSPATQCRLAPSRSVLSFLSSTRLGPLRQMTYAGNSTPLSCQPC